LAGLTIVGVAKHLEPDPVKPDFPPLYPDPVEKNCSGTPLVIWFKMFLT
jgi:hypothetical protein